MLHFLIVIHFLMVIQFLMVIHFLMVIQFLMFLNGKILNGGTRLWMYMFLDSDARSVMTIYYNPDSCLCCGFLNVPSRFIVFEQL